MANNIFDSLSPADKQNAYANAIVKLKETNDPRFPEARAWYLQTYLGQQQEARFQGSPHLKPTYDEYYAQAEPGFLGTKWKPMGSDLKSRLNALIPPSPQELLSRPYIVPPVGGGKTQGGAVTQDYLGGLVRAAVDSPSIQKDFVDPVIGFRRARPQEDYTDGTSPFATPRAKFGALYPNAPGGPGDPSGYERMAALSGEEGVRQREQLLSPVRDFIEQGMPMGFGFHEPVTPLPTQQEREQHVGLTPQEATQQSWVPGLNRGEFAGLGQSLELMIPALATMLATKNPAASLTMFAPPVFGKTYDEHIKSGKTPEESLELAKKAVIFEVVPELLLWGPFKLVKKPIMAIFASIPAEAASEAITEIGYIQDEIRNQGKEFTSEQIIARIEHAAKMGAYMGPAMGMGFSLPSMFNAVAKGKPKQVVKILQKLRKKMVASGVDNIKIEIIDQAIETLNDNTLSVEEHAAALKALTESDALGAFFQPYKEGGFRDWERAVAGKPERTGAAIFSPEAIINRLTQDLGRAPSRSQVKERMKELIDEEVGQHGGLYSLIQGLGLSIEEQDKFYDRMLRENADAIEAWKVGEGRVYAEADGTFKDGIVVDEWLAYLNRQRQKGLTIGQAPIGKYIRHIRKTFKEEADLDLSTAEASEIVDRLQRNLERGGTRTTGDMGAEHPRIITDPSLSGTRFAKSTESVSPSSRTVLGGVEKTPDTSQEDLDAAIAEREVQETILDEQLSSLERDTLGDTRFAKGPDIDNRRQTAIAKAMAPNKHIRESDLRMNAIKENWEDNKDDLEFRRDYANFKEFEQAEWDLNYDMWIDEVQEAEAEETDTNVTQLKADPSIEELRAAREATQLQLTQINEQLASLERDTMGDTRFAKTADTDVKQLEVDTSKTDLEDATRERVLQETILEEQLSGFERDFTGETRFAKAADLDAAGILNRNVRNDFAKGPYKDIAERADEAEIRARIKRLGNLYGPMGQKRGVEPGDRATAKEQAQNAIDNVDAFEEFIAPFEEQMQAQPAESKTATGRQKKYAERKGITVADILSYRDRGKTHPMEKKMSYSFAMDEINRLEEAGEATAEEAEARRRALNDLRNQLGGKMPPGAKRKATEITYGIGDYANLEAWDYTDTETAGMEERAEVARGQERVRGLSRTKKTEQELEEITGTDVTPTEMLQIASMAEVEAFDHLKSDEARLRYLREKEAMPASERDALDAFMKDIKGWNQKAYEEQVAAELEAQVEKVGVTKVEQTPAQRKAELKDIKEAQAPIDKRKHMQVEPDFFDTLVDTNFTMQGESVPDGFMELTEDGEWSEVDDTDTRFAKAGESRMTVEARDYLITVPYFELKLDHDNLDSKGRPKIIENDLGREYWTYDKYGEIVPWESKWGMGDMTEVEAAINAMEAATLELEMPIALTNKIHRNLDDRVSQSKGGYDRGVEALREVNEGLVAILRKIYLKKGIDKSGRALTFEHLRRKLGEKTVTKQYQSILDMLGDKDVIPSKSFTITDFTKGMEKSWNIALVHPIPDKIKTAWQQGIKFQSKSERKGRFDADTPYTSALKFLQLGEKINQSEAAPKNDNEKHALAFYEKMTKDYGSDVVEKLDAYVTTMKTMKPESVAATVVKSALEWEGAGSIPSEFIQEIAALDTMLASVQTKNKYGITDSLANIASDNMTRFAKRSKGDSYEEHFNKSFWYTLTSYLWGKPVQAIRDFNKLSRFGQAKADIPAADEIADEVQRAHSSTQRAESLVYGTDIVQDTSIMTGKFYTRLAQIFSRVTARFGDIETKENQILVDVLTGKIRIEEIDNAEVREAAKLLRELIQEVYDYAKTETKGLKKPLDLRGHGDTLLPRVWNIEFLATRRGKAKFLKAIRAAISDPATGSSILEDSELTVEDLFNVVVNSGGFVQGDWTNLKADQTRDQKDIDKDLRAQEYLDALPTESLIDEDLVMIDLQAIIPRFLQKAVERTEYSKRFGVNDEILRAKIKEGLEQIKVHNAKVLKLDKTDTSLTYIDPRAFEKSIWDMARILRNKYGYDMANMQTRAWLQRVVNFEVVAKLPLVTLASMPELFTPMLRGDVRADKWIVDFMMGLSWAGYKGMNGISKLLLNKHLPAMRKMSKDIGGIGVVSDMQLLRELGIAEIQAMGDSVSTRYANPNFARGGLRAGARTTIAGRIPKKVRAVFNMQTYMQATLLTTLTEMQQLMALRNFQRHMAKRVKFVQKNKDKELKGRRLRLFKQFSKDMADFGLPQNIDLSTPAGEAEFNAGAIRFVDQVITRPNDATTAKAFKNPLTAPIFLFKRFITTFGNTLMTAVGNDIATKVDNIEKAKQVGRVATTMVAMYGAVMFAEIIRGAIKGDLDEDDMTVTGGDFRTFVRRVDRTGLLSAPGAMLLNLSFPYKRGWWDSPEARIWGELGGPIGGDLSALMKTGFDRRPGSAQRLIRQMIPMSKQLIDLPPKKKRASKSKTRKVKIPKLTY